MVTMLGKFLRFYRLNHNQLLKDMADKLGLTSAYLSSIENGKRKPTEEFIKNVKETYNLSEQEHDDLMDAYFQTIQSITIDTSDAKQEQADLGLIFARKIKSLDEDDIAQIKKILNK